MFALTKYVIPNLTNAGVIIVSIISDNNVVNKKMFIYLSDSDHLMPYIINHVNNIDNLKKSYLIVYNLNIFVIIGETIMKYFALPVFNETNKICWASFAE